MVSLSRYTKFTVGFCFAVLANWSSPSLAQDGSQVRITASGEELIVDGEIDTLLRDRFYAAAAANPDIKLVRLNSPGGRIIPALEMARLVKSRQWDTRIDADKECHSACSFVFLAGRSRIANGLLGVHQVSGVNDPSITQSAISLIYEELVAFNTPSYLVSRMLRTPPDDMYVFAPEELERYAINVRSPDAVGALPHLQAVETVLRGDWLVGAFMNNNINMPFLALESSQMDPLLRIVHYPHRRSSFIEIMYPAVEIAASNTKIELRFGHGSDRPYSLIFDADVEADAIAFDMPTDPEEERLFWTAFTAATDLTVLTGRGLEIGRFSLAGSRRATADFASMLSR